MVDNNVSKYWDMQAKRKIVSGDLDNIWKRQVIVRNLLEYDFYDKSVLEIGVGPGTTFASIGLILLNRFSYVGTDTSSVYVDFASKKWGMNTVQSDVTNLPGKNNSYDYIVSLDTLAHVKVDQRKDGYKEMNRVLKSSGKIILNITVKGTELDPNEFHWGFSYYDLEELVKICSLKLEKVKAYDVKIPITGEVRSYEFIVGGR